MKSLKHVAASILSLTFACMAGALNTVHAAPAASGPAPVVQACSWDKPGRDPFVGDVVAAVDRYKDIPADVRAKLKQRMAVRSYDEFVAIERDGIVGKQAYGAAIRDMHFGEGRICKTVTRAKWTASMRERGMVYCEGEHCILVPTVCRNVSRITRLASGAGATAAGGAPQAETILADNLQGLNDGATDPLAGDGVLLDGGAPGTAGNGALTFSQVASAGASTPGLLAGGAGAVFMAQTQFGSPFTGGSGGYNPGGGENGTPGAPGSGLEWGTSPVPEAPAWMMMGLAVMGLGLAGARRRRTVRGR